MEARDWAALPRDILLDVFFVLGPREVMLGAEFVCMAWRRTALEEPSLWRCIGRDRWFGTPNLDPETAMRFAAVNRAAGQCEAFTGTCDDEELQHLVTRAPSLKSLHIEHDCDESSCEDLVEALENLTLLEDLRVSWTYICHMHDTEDLLQSVCKACPHLKKLRIWYNEEFGCVGPIDVGNITMMHELRHLQLYEVDLSCYALKSILDSCPLLETLYIRGFFNKRDMDGELRMKCAGLKKLSLFTRSRRHNRYVDFVVDGFFEEEDSD
ncbi:unnamed protein product [Urochloa decumbens]|uniref:F-box domain-containing protein n=1 Tax=Urochloa decumbens TaxID=240449 RepID=A0ABC9BVG4_9POAL